MQLLSLKDIAGLPSCLEAGASGDTQTSTSNAAADPQIRQSCKHDVWTLADWDHGGYSAVCHPRQAHHHNAEGHAARPQNQTWYLLKCIGCRSILQHTADRTRSAECQLSLGLPTIATSSPGNVSRCVRNSSSLYNPACGRGRWNRSRSCPYLYSDTSVQH